MCSGSGCGSGIGSGGVVGRGGAADRTPFPGVELDFNGEGYLTSFALPNFHFHVSMVCAILRQHGVPLGKKDCLSQLARI